MDEWTSENWLVSGNGGHRPEAGAAATHFYAMQGPGRRLEVYGIRVVSDSDVGAKETVRRRPVSESPIITGSVTDREARDLVMH
jgi:hypothetical protein